MRVSLKRSFIFLFLIICAVLLFYLLNYNLLSENNYKSFSMADIRLFPEDSLRTDRVLEQLSYVPKLKETGPVVIRLDPSLSTWGLEPGEVEFQKAGCLVQNCIFTDKDPKNISDAVLFKSAYSISHSKRPNNKQIWIFYSLEAPPYSGNLTLISNLINWTATYRWDSDVVAPYGRFALKHQIPKDQLPSKWPELEPNRNYAKGKTKQVIGFVSNCRTNNRRENYIAELSKFISVHIYGHCGQYVCRKREQQSCDQIINKEYKFYLAFENANCIDYVTEKFVNGLRHNIIPVVMGAQTEHYKRIAPPHSFIHVDDFKTPQHLAVYLKYLYRNDTAYNEYFEWKGTGQFINTKFWCRLCALLNNPRPKTYQSLEKWWRSDETCWGNVTTAL